MAIDLGGFVLTTGHVVAGAVLLVALAVLRKLFEPTKVNPHVVRVACKCGWVGDVSKYKPVCPSCSQPVKPAATA